MDPYMAAFSDHIPDYFDDIQDVPQFDIQYLQVPSMNYYTFKSNKANNVQNSTHTQSESTGTETTDPTSSTEVIAQPETGTEVNVQPDVTANKQPNDIPLQDIDFLDDSFDFQLSSLQNPEIENMLQSISNNCLEKMADENNKFNQRFVHNNDAERDQFIESRENINTKRKMSSAIRIFTQFLLNVKSEFREIHTIECNELDQYLQEFYVGIRKETKNEAKDIEKEYQPSSLDSFQCMISRYLRLRNYPFDITKDKQFQKSRECLTAKKKQLKEMGLGNKPNAAEAVDSDDEEELYNSGAFGLDNADSLLSSIWYMNTVNFGLRGSHEHRQLKWGDIKFETDQNGVQTLIYNERLTKTRDGSNTKNTRAYAPKSWANQTDNRKFHIATYLKYRSQRPAKAFEPESPFYLGINKRNNAKQWFKNQPLGEKSLKTLMRTAIEKSNVNKNKKYTNHSGRKTAITRLIEGGMPLTSVQQHTGHRSMASLNSYAINSEKTQKKINNLLSRKPTATITREQVHEQAEQDNSNESYTDLNDNAMDDFTRSKEITKHSYASLCTKQGGTETIQTPSAMTPKPQTPNAITQQPQTPNEITPQPGPCNFGQLFPTGTIIHGGTFNLYIGQCNDKHEKENQPPKSVKRKKFVIDSDSD